MTTDRPHNYPREANEVARWIASECDRPVEYDWDLEREQWRFRVGTGPTALRFRVEVAVFERRAGHVMLDLSAAGLANVCRDHPGTIWLFNADGKLSRLEMSA